MAIWFLGLFSKWSTVTGANRMQCAIDFPAEWTDVSEQDDTIIKNRSTAFCFLALGHVSDAVLTAIQANANYLILVRWEDADVPSFDNRQSIITIAQRDTFVTYFSTQFGINVAKIPVIQNSPGRTRAAVLRDVVADMKGLT